MNSIDNGMNGKLAGLDGKPAGRSDGENAGTRRADGAAASSADRSASQAQTETAAGEAVSLTRTAADLQQLEAQLRETSGVDVARVQAFREAIAEGRYTVDATSLVDSLLKSERELG